MESFSALVPAELTRLRELRIALTAWLERCTVEKRAREATVLATHEAAAAAIRNRWRSIRVSATLAEATLAVEVHATHRVQPLDTSRSEVRPELEPIEPYQLIDGLIDQVNVQLRRERHHGANAPEARRRLRPLSEANAASENGTRCAKHGETPCSNQELVEAQHPLAFTQEPVPLRRARREYPHPARRSFAEHMPLTGCRGGLGPRPPVNHRSLRATNASMQQRG